MAKKGGQTLDTLKERALRINYQCEKITSLGATRFALWTPPGAKGALSATWSPSLEQLQLAIENKEREIAAANTKR